ncbi:MAG: ketopantoate reductase family protein [Candidatus Geothermarchaeales archaeon]
MKIAVMGAGAIGSLIGGLLADRGFDIILISRRVSHMEAIAESGLRISGVSGKRDVRVKAYTDPSKVGPCGLVLLTVKAYDTRQALADSEPLLSKNTSVLSLQNGLGNFEQVIAAVGRMRALVGVTSHGAFLVSNGEVRHTGQGTTYIGSISTLARRTVEKVVYLFRNASLEARVAEDVRATIWRKVLVNLAINAPTALSGLRNGQLLDNPGLRWVMKKVVQEGEEVCRGLGVRVEKGAIEEAFAVAKRTSENFSSMLQDIKRGRRTEIDFLNGRVVVMGEEMGLSLPVNKVLTSLVRAREGRQIA